MAVNTTFKRKWGDKKEIWLNYFGDSYSVRGWALPNQELYYSGAESFRFGHESVQTTIELRKDIIPKYATKYGVEFGLGVVAFLDAGIISESWTDLLSQSPMLGTGIGLRIPIPMVDVLRIDYGWGYKDGDWNSGSIHWSVEQKF